MSAVGNYFFFSQTVAHCGAFFSKKDETGIENRRKLNKNGYLRVPQRLGTRVGQPRDTLGQRSKIVNESRTLEYNKT